MRSSASWTGRDIGSSTSHKTEGWDWGWGPALGHAQNGVSVRYPNLVVNNKLDLKIKPWRLSAFRWATFKGTTSGVRRGSQPSLCLISFHWQAWDTRCAYPSFRKESWGPVQWREVPLKPHGELVSGSGSQSSTVRGSSDFVRSKVYPVKKKNPNLQKQREA